jgi:hypothetical protein
MSDQPQQPDVIDPDNIPETICDGAFNLSFVGPNAVITFTHMRPEAEPLFTRGSKRQTDSTIPHCDLSS